MGFAVRFITVIKGCLLASLFLFSASLYADDYYYSSKFDAEDECVAAYQAAAAPYGSYPNNCQHEYNVRYWYELRVGSPSELVASGSYFYGSSSCPPGTVLNDNTNKCESLPDPLPTDCDARSPILSDTGVDDFSYQSCNYHQCGTVVNADQGTYNVSFCTDSGQGEGGCDSTLLGCLPENPNPYSNDLEDGCMSFGGKTICMLDDDNQCYEVDGVSKCFEKDSVCGVKNGAYQCVDNTLDNCGQFNGETVCFEPNPDGTVSPEIIDPNSADHPDNGGNADGDDTNDVADSRPVAEGGDSNNQPTDNKLTKKDLKKSLLDAQYLVNEQLKRGMWEGIPSGTGIQDSVRDSSDTVGDEYLQSGQDIIDGVVANNQFFSEQNAIEQLGSGVVGGITVGAACTSIPINIPTVGTYYVDCFYLDKTREFLSYLFYFLTAWTLFTILTRPVEAK